jgi:VWFA-related protein
MKLSYLVCVLFILSWTLPVFAQDDDPVTVNTTLVRLNVGVVDRQGRPIVDLNRSSFTVYEDEVKQEISKFEPTVAPFSVVLMLDVSGSTIPLRQIITQAATRFLDALAPDDRVAVISFDEKITQLTDFTTNRKDIAYAISIAKGRGKTKFYNALDFAFDKLKKEGSRRKAVVVLTDGVDTEFRDKDRETANRAKNTEEIATIIKPEANEKLNQLLNNADRLGVTIYPLALPSGDPKKLADPTPIQVAMYTAARQRLQILADRSGGSLNAINRLEDMGKLYAAVAAELRTLYSVEYESSNERPRESKWRKIRIEVNRPEVIAKTRPGYFTK